MESYIPVSYLNDFVYSPESIYLHSVYQDFGEAIYKDIPQVNGAINHESIDTHKYSSSRHLLQGVMFFSQKYGLCGKIDVFNTKTGELVERKSRIKKVFSGYKYQLYAERQGLIEMGYKVNKMFLHSLEDNKRYAVPVPNIQEQKEFEEVIEKIKNFNPLDILKNPHVSKTAQLSIYKNLGF
jgi:CRISPR-associated exonuclease Cas4